MWWVSLYAVIKKKVYIHKILHVQVIRKYALHVLNLWTVYGAVKLSKSIESDICFIPTFFGNKNNVGQDDIVAVRVFCHCKAWRAVTISIVFFVDPEIVLLMLLFASNTFYLSSWPQGALKLNSLRICTISFVQTKLDWPCCMMNDSPTVLKRSLVAKEYCFNPES